MHIMLEQFFQPHIPSLNISTEKCQEKEGQKLHTIIKWYTDIMLKNEKKDEPN